MTIRKQYVWKELTEHGLLVEPEKTGPYYSRDSLNPTFSAFETTEEAEERLEWFLNECLYCKPENFVLVTVYNDV